MADSGKKTLKELIVPNRKSALMTIKASKADIEKIKSMAEKYADGNMSAWIRHAALKYTPKKKDLA